MSAAAKYTKGFIVEKRCVFSMWISGWKFRDRLTVSWDSLLSTINHIYGVITARSFCFISSPFPLPKSWFRPSSTSLGLCIRPCMWSLTHLIPLSGLAQVLVCRPLLKSLRSLSTVLKIKLNFLCLEIGLWQSAIFLSMLTLCFRHNLLSNWIPFLPGPPG